MKSRSENLNRGSALRVLAACLLCICACVSCLGSAAWGWFTATSTASVDAISAGAVSFENLTVIAISLPSQSSQSEEGDAQETSEASSESAAEGTPAEASEEPADDAAAQTPEETTVNVTDGVFEADAGHKYRIDYTLTGSAKGYLRIEYGNTTLNVTEKSYTLEGVSGNVKLTAMWGEPPADTNPEPIDPIDEAKENEETKPNEGETQPGEEKQPTGEEQPAGGEQPEQDNEQQPEQDETKDPTEPDASAGQNDQQEQPSEPVIEPETPAESEQTKEE